MLTFELTPEAVAIAGGLMLIFAACWYAFVLARKEGQDD